MNTKDKIKKCFEYDLDIFMSLLLIKVRCLLRLHNFKHWDYSYARLTDLQKIRSKKAMLYVCIGCREERWKKF